MQRSVIEAADAPAAAGGYAQGVLVEEARRMLFVSGQIPVDRDGAVPDGFRAQAHLAWRNLQAQLRAAGMTLDNLVKVTVFLADRAHRLENREVRLEVLGDRRLAMTVIIAGIFDEAWLIEIEGIACD
jgi:enamine deaminase RidA (YjgF/YER057c/UK114 family)